VELGPAQGGGNGAEQEHGIEEDKAADSGVRVLAKNHESDEPDGRALEVQFFGGPVGQGHTGGSPEGVELAHEGVIELGRICLAGLELERAIVACQIAAETDQKFTGRRVDVEVEFSLEIMASKLAKAGLHLVSASRTERTAEGRLTDCASSHVTIFESPIL
jgi:hypothetical protein